MLSEMATFEYMENITIMADKLAAYAAASGYKTALKYLLVTRHVMAGGLTAARDDEGTPLLGLAVRGGHAECVKLLLKHGADPNATSRTLGAPPLALACVHGAEGCIAQLVKARANQLRVWRGRTPLQWALRRNHRSCAQALLDAGRLINKQLPLWRDVDIVIDDDEISSQALKTCGAPFDKKHYKKQRLPLVSGTARRTCVVRVSHPCVIRATRILPRVAIG